MVRRFRFLTALLALLALSAYGAEATAFGALCQQAGAGQQDSAQHGAHDGHGSSHDDSPMPEHGSHCPLGMIGGGPCVAASLPAPSGLMITSFSESAEVFGAPGSAHDLARAQFLFRPPRA